MHRTKLANVRRGPENRLLTKVTTIYIPTCLDTQHIDKQIRDVWIVV